MALHMRKSLLSAFHALALQIFLSLSYLTLEVFRRAAEQAPRHLTKMSDPKFGILDHFRRMDFGRFRGVSGALRSDLRSRRTFRRTMDQTSAATTLLDRH